MTRTGGESLDVPNYQCVGVNDRHVVVVLPQQKMTPMGALLHAAWLVACAEAIGLREGNPTVDEKFAEFLAEVRNT